MGSRHHTKRRPARPLRIADLQITLRALRKADGPAIVRMYRRPEVSRFLSMPITSLGVFSKYYRWVKRQRRAGLCASFTVRVHGRIVGLVQVRVTHPGVGELGWILDPSVWGSHVFRAAASSLCEFASRTMRLVRLEARVAMRNVRARRAMAKIGASCEGRLHASLRLRERYLDEELWAISRDSLAWVRGDATRTTAHRHRGESMRPHKLVDFRSSRVACRHSSLSVAAVGRAVAA